MKRIIPITAFALFAICFYANAQGQKADTAALKIVFIRHGEKPDTGDNLNCTGFNRSIQLPKVLHDKIGIPACVFVPKLGLGAATKQSRMFQTVSPFAIKYNLAINTTLKKDDSVKVAKVLKSLHGTILLVWEHKAIAPIVRQLGINDPGLKWAGSDFDSIWIVTFKNGTAKLTKSKEGITHLSKHCQF
jgi:hypothetical protein